MQCAHAGASLPALLQVRWITFHSGYDFGYLLKLLTCQSLPSNESEFFELLKVGPGTLCLPRLSSQLQCTATWVLLLSLARAACAQSTQVSSTASSARRCLSCNSFLNKCSAASAQA